MGDAAKRITWRLMAQALIPEAWTEAAEPGSQRRTIYGVFLTLRAVVREAHFSNDTEQLTRAYAFAEWCARHKSRDIWNAASVAFYEHALDDGLSEKSVGPWLSPKVLEDTKQLIIARYGEAKASDLARHVRSGVDAPWRAAVRTFAYAEKHANARARASDTVDGQ